jgi:hypothetical protein
MHALKNMYGKQKGFCHCFCPHSEQKRAEAGILLLHFGQIFNKRSGSNKIPQKLQ